MALGGSSGLDSTTVHLNAGNVNCILYLWT